MEKKSQIQSSYLIWTIIIIAGFAVLAYVFFRLNLGGQVDSQVCHESVVLRGTVPDITQGYVNLKCKAEHICVTSGLLTKGNCTKEYGVGAKGITYVKVNSKSDVEKLVAQSIVECWSMMGEGKVSVFSQYAATNYGFGVVYPTCLVCSRIAFDKTALDRRGIYLNALDVMTYMRTHTVPGKEISYYDYISGESNAKFDVKTSFNIPKNPDAKNAQDIGTIPVDSITPAEIENQRKDDILQYKPLAVMFMQMSAPSHVGSALNVGKVAIAAVAGSFAIAPGTSWDTTKGIAKLCTAGGWVGPAVCAGLLVIGGAIQQGSVAYNRAITAGYCGDLSVGGEARDGCSVVRTVNYDEAGMREYCSLIEGVS